jgi:hypothetical protein
MRMLHRKMFSALLVLGCSACYHATIETGLPPSNETISKAWAHGFLWGLVSPSTVETASKCKNGVAKVETQHSFLNGLVSAITYGIYTPIEIDVTCAASNKMASNERDGGTTTIRAADQSLQARTAALVTAISTSAQSGQAVFVSF